jgi:hypothetical protein
MGVYGCTNFILMLWIRGMVTWTKVVSFEDWWLGVENTDTASSLKKRCRKVWSLILCITEVCYCASLILCYYLIWTYICIRIKSGRCKSWSFPLFPYIRNLLLASICLWRNLGLGRMSEGLRQLREHNLRRFSHIVCLITSFRGIISATFSRRSSFPSWSISTINLITFIATTARAL